MPTSLLRQLKQSDIVCPAGTLFGDATIRCGVEESLIDAREDSTSAAAFCCGDHGACPSWRAEVDSKVGVSKSLDAQIREREILQQRRQVQQARIAEKQRLLKDPGPEGEKFRAKLRRKLAEIERQRLAA